MTLTDTRRIGLLAVGLTFVALFVSNVVGNGADENGGVSLLILSFAICSAIAAWLFGRTMPRAVEAGPSTSATQALVLSVLAALSFPFFWSGIPYVLGPAGIALGLASRSRGGGTKAILAVAIGTIALLAGIGVLVADELDLL